MKIRLSEATAVSILIFAIFAIFTTIASSAPAGINYQGRYTENDVPFNGNKTFLFELYDDPAAGNLLWTSGNVSLNVSNGLFNYTLNCSTVDWQNKDAYLKVTVDGTALTPRERLNASAYSFYTSSAGYAYNIHTSINGTKTFTSSFTVAADARITGTLNFGNPSRGINDNTADYEVGVTSHLYVTGNIRTGGSFSGKIVSSYTYISGWSNATTDNAWEDITNVSVTFTMPAAGTIFGFFTCNYKDTDGGFISYEMMLDATTEFGIAGDDSDTTKVKSITCIGAVPASAGQHTVKVRRKGDSTVTNKLGSQQHSLTITAWTTP